MAKKQTCRLDDISATVLTGVPMQVNTQGRPTSIIDFPESGMIDINYIEKYSCIGCNTDFKALKPGDPTEITKAWQAALEHLEG